MARRKRKSQKGGPYERELCWLLSRWWTGNSHELVFWRTSNSGGGATVRHRKGISNRAHAGDITAIEATAKPFSDLITIEAKRGYNKTTNLHSLLDRLITKRTVPHMLEDWIVQARNAAERAGTKFWMLIHRRDHGEAICFMPTEFIAAITIYTNPMVNPLPLPLLTLKFNLRDGKKTVPTSIVGMKLKHFLFHVDPDDIRNMLEGTKR